MHGGPAATWISPIPSPSSPSTAAPIIRARSPTASSTRPAKSCWAARSASASTAQCGTELSEMLPHTAKIVDDICVDPLDAHRHQRTRAVDLVHEHGPSAAGPPGSRLVAHLRLGLRKPEPARVHRHARSGRPPGRRRAELVQRLDAAAVPGDGDPRKSRGFSTSIRRRTSKATCSGKISIFSPGSTAGTSNAIPARPTSRPASPATSWPPACSRPPKRPSTSRRRRRPRKTCTASTGPRRANTARGCLIARRLVERGVRFVQIFIAGQIWDLHAQPARRPRRVLREDRQAGRRPRHRSQAARPARQDARPLGGRNRPPARDADGGRPAQRPRPQRPGLQHLAGRRRLQGRHDLRRRPTSSATARPSNNVSPNDYHATLLHLFGLDAERLTYFSNGKAHTLLDGAKCRVVKEILKHA